MTALGLSLALLVGLSLGLLGGGGSILTVPILVYALGFDPKQAIAMSLAIVIEGSLSFLGLSFLRQKGGARWILLTNFDHLRGSMSLKEAMSASILAPSEERGRFGVHADGVDLWVGSTRDLPADLKEELEVFPLHGGKSPVEFAVFLKQPRALVFGDLVRSHASGRLMLLPDAKLRDRQAAIDSLRPLVALSAAAILLGDGDSIFYRGGEAFAEFLGGLSR